MAVTDMDLEMRSRQWHRINLTFAGLVTVAGAGLMITIALLPLGLLIFLAGLIWLGVGIWLGRADRNRRETQRSPSEPKAI